MSDVKKIKVGNTSYDVKDEAVRTQIARVNVYKGNDGKIHFVNYNGTDVVVYQCYICEVIQMSNVKKIKVGSTSYNCKDATARTQVGRINLTKSGNDLKFTDYNGTVHTITGGAGTNPEYPFVYYQNSYPNGSCTIFNTITGYLPLCT